MVCVSQCASNSCNHGFQSMHPSKPIIPTAAANFPRRSLSSLSHTRLLLGASRDVGIDYASRIGDALALRARPSQVT